MVFSPAKASPTSAEPHASSIILRIVRAQRPHWGAAAETTIDLARGAALRHAGGGTHLMVAQHVAGTDDHGDSRLGQRRRAILVLDSPCLDHKSKTKRLFRDVLNSSELSSFRGDPRRGWRGGGRPCRAWRKCSASCRGSCRDPGKTAFAVAVLTHASGKPTTALHAGFHGLHGMHNLKLERIRQ